MPPQTWQKANPDGSYDLAIVGGGIGAAYLVHRLSESFAANEQPLPKIALFERTENIGGRLVSAYGAGGFGKSVIPRTGVASTKASPLQEYGGMRIDPYKFPLVFNTAIKIAKRMSELHDPPLQCDVNTEDPDSQCPLAFVRMYVGKVRFATTNKDLGTLMSSSTVSTKTEVNYCPSDIKNGDGSPFDKCVQLAVSPCLVVHVECLSSNHNIDLRCCLFLFYYTYAHRLQQMTFGQKRGMIRVRPTSKKAWKLPVLNVRMASQAFVSFVNSFPSQLRLS